MVALLLGERGTDLTRSRRPRRRLHLASSRTRRSRGRARRPARARCARSYEQARLDPPRPHARRRERDRRRGRAPRRIHGRPARGDERGAGARRSRADRPCAPASSRRSSGGSPRVTWHARRRPFDASIRRSSRSRARTAKRRRSSTPATCSAAVGGSLASPASFNNAAGLSRAINEHLAPGTEVFIAEMGTYGAGEIEAMTRWIKPTVGVITAIGPVHLERMKTLDGIVAAKAEILDAVDTAVLNVDAHGLASLADRTRLRGVTVVACSAQAEGAAVDVRATRDGGRLTIDAGAGRRASIESDAHASNLACAIAIALALDVSWDEIVDRLAVASSPRTSPRGRHRRLGSARHRQHLQLEPGERRPRHSRCWPEAAKSRRERVVVTPGMVELGSEQGQENKRFAAAAACRRRRRDHHRSHEPECAARGRDRRPRRDARDGDPRGSGRAGFVPSSSPAMSCCTRTTCPTTIPEPCRSRA